MKKYLGCFDDEFALFEIEIKKEQGFRRFSLYRLISYVDAKDEEENKSK